jgi:peptidoglycan/LPS O-acetylase OafA/YrhL
VLALAVVALVSLIALRGAVEQTDAVLWIASFPLAALATAAALTAATAAGRIATTLSFTPLRWFGRYSYGLYVWHPIVGMLLFHSKLSIVPDAPSGVQMLAAAAFAFVLNLVIAWLSFHLWEQRFLALKRFFPATPARAAAKPAAAAPAAAAGQSTPASL